MTADEKPITPGERLFYALGQLYALWKRGELPVRPTEFDIDDLARIIGVARDIEFMTRGPAGCSYHFPDEVLVVDYSTEFPWTLLDLDTWAVVVEAAGLDQ